MYRPHPRRLTATTSVLVAVLAACSSASQTATNMSPVAQSGRVAISVRSDAQIFGALHSANAGEMTAGLTAQQKGTDSAVKSFASMMMSEHSRLDQQGSTLAQQIGVTPTLTDSTLPRQQRAELDSLRAAPEGPSFDRLYITQQVAAHQRTIDLVDASLAVAQHAELKTALQSQIRPVVMQHLSRARQIQEALGGGIAAAPANGATPRSGADTSATKTKTP